MNVLVVLGGLLALAILLIVALEGASFRIVDRRRDDADYRPRLLLLGPTRPHAEPRVPPAVAPERHRHHQPAAARPPRPGHLDQLQTRADHGLVRRPPA